MWFGLKKTIAAAAITAASGFISQSGLAQSAPAQTINVPFEFTAQGHDFPSGLYAVEQNPSRHLVILHAANGGAKVNWTINSGAGSPSLPLVLSFSQAAGIRTLKSIEYGRRVSPAYDPFGSAKRNPVPLRTK